MAALARSFERAARYTVPWREYSRRASSLPTPAEAPVTMKILSFREPEGRVVSVKVAVGGKAWEMWLPIVASVAEEARIRLLSLRSQDVRPVVVCSSARLCSKVNICG